MPSAQTISRLIPFGLPILSILVSIPLALQRIPPNYWYGFRTRKTLSDRQIWYRANYLGGVNMFWAGVAAVGVNAVLASILDQVLFQILGSLVVLITVAVAIAVSLQQLRNL